MPIKKRLGNAGQIAVAVVGEGGALLGAVDALRYLAQGVVCTLVSGPSGIGELRWAIRQRGVVIGEGGGAFWPGDFRWVAAVVAGDLPGLVVGAVDVNGLAEGIALDGPAAAVRGGLAADHIGKRHCLNVAFPMYASLRLYSNTYT